MAKRLWWRIQRCVFLARASYTEFLVRSGAAREGRQWLSCRASFYQWRAASIGLWLAMERTTRQMELLTVAWTEKA